MDFTFHLIGNAHLDPVWLWDWHEGLNEGLITCRTILDLMNENPEMTFVRGESAIYQHIERTDPETFQRIAEQVRNGRWDVVGGTVVQPDTNLPATETLARHFLRGQRYFKEKFGKFVRVAWAADSFGHAAGLPEILVEAGIEAFACTRPPPALLSISKPAFWWEGPSGARVLAYRPEVGSYVTRRGGTLDRLDEYLADARKHGLHNVGCFYGLGNHGGGPTRAMLREIRDWASSHPEVCVTHSGLHRFFDSLRDELREKGDYFIPTHRGEMNYVLRGCYSSVAKFKFPFRRAEAILSRAETTDTVISAALCQSPTDLSAEWNALLFNSFHDILPGSSIERAYTDQLAWLGIAYHGARAAELKALNLLALRINTCVRPANADMPTGVAILVWNPHPWQFNGYVELEACLDYRFIKKYENNVGALPVQVLGSNGQPLPFQIIANEHSSSRRHAWRKRALVPLKIQPLGWTVLEMGWVENPKLAKTASNAVCAKEIGEIRNEKWRVFAKAGQTGIHFARNGTRLFGKKGLSAVVYEDPFGCWGDMSDNPNGMLLKKILDRWKVRKMRILENGPYRAMMWLRLSGNTRSWMELKISLCQERDAVDIFARVLWNERSSRLKLVMPGGERAEYDVPGASVMRGPSGEVPGGRWVHVSDGNDGIGFASDSLYNFDTSDGEFRATIVRATRYAADAINTASEEPWGPAVDAGELTFSFLLCTDRHELPRLAAELEKRPIALLVPPTHGELPRKGSWASLSPATLELLALKPSDDGQGFIVRIRETKGKATRPLLRWMGQDIKLAMIDPFKIATWRIHFGRAGWNFHRSTITETR